MTTVINYKYPDARVLYEEIKRRCRILVQKEGSEYIYSHETKSIEHQRIDEKYVDIFSVVTLTDDKLVAIVPFEVARSLSCSEPIPPLNEPTLQVTFRGELRAHQIDGSSRAIDSLRTTGRCYFQAPPSYGKTVIMSYVISIFREKTLIIVPNLALAEQTKTSIDAMLSGAKVYIMDKVIPDDADILISFIRRIPNQSAPISRFKTVILDEVHLLTTAQGIPPLLSMRPRRLLALTATPGDRNKITELFVGKCEIKEKGRRWCIAFPRIISGLDGSKYSSVEGYTEAMSDLTHSVSFTSTIARMVAYFVSIRKRVIVLTMRKEMCETIAEVLRGSNQSNPISIGVLTPESRKCGNCDVIIGTHKLIGTGFDLSNYIDDFDGVCASVMIFLGSIKDKTLMYQASGRGFRARDPLAIYPNIVDLPISNTHTQKLIMEAKKTDGCEILTTYSLFLERFGRSE